MAKLLMMTGTIAIVLGLLGFLVLLVKGRAAGKTSPVLQALKAAGIRTTEAEQRLCRQRVWVSNDMLMTPREQHFYRALLKHTDRKRWLLCPQVRVATPYPTSLPDLVAAVPDGLAAALRSGRGGYQDLCHCGRCRTG